MPRRSSRPTSRQSAVRPGEHWDHRTGKSWWGQCSPTVNCHNLRLQSKKLAPAKRCKTYHSKKNQVEGIAPGTLIFCTVPLYHVILCILKRCVLVTRLTVKAMVSERVTGLCKVQLKTSPAAQASHFLCKCPASKIRKLMKNEK